MMTEKAKAPQGCDSCEAGKTNRAIRSENNTSADRKPFINGQAWKQSGLLQLPAEELKVLLGFMSFQNVNSHTAFCGDEAVAEVLAVTDRSVRRVRKKLIERGVMVLKRRAHPIYKTQEFSFHVPADRTFMSGGDDGDNRTFKPGGDESDRTSMVERPDIHGQTTGRLGPPNALSNASSEYLESRSSPDGETKPAHDQELDQKPDLPSKENLPLPESVMLPAPDALVLSPPPDRDLRHRSFRSVLCAFYTWKWHYACPWGAEDGAQLKRFLDLNPTLEEATFKRWLLNYSNSHNITPGERPFRFLPRMDTYSVEPIDKFRTSFNAPIITAKLQNTMRTAMAMEQVRQDDMLQQAALPEPPERVKAPGQCDIHRCGLVFDEDGTRVCEVAGVECVFANRWRRLNA